MRQWLAELIIPFADTMHSLVMAIPLEIVRALVFAILAALAVWVILMPPQLPEKEDGGQYSILKDLRLLALAVLLLQAAFYIIL